MRSSLGPIAACARADLRRRRYTFAALALLLGLLGGSLLAAVAGARRTDSAFNRMLAATDAGDAYMEVCNEEMTREECAATSAETTDALRASAEVRDLVTVGRYVGIMEIEGGAIIQSECESGIGQVEILASTDPRYATSFQRPLITDGRAPDPTRRDEIAISPALAASGVKVGDTISSELGSYCSEEQSPQRSHLSLDVVGVAVDWGGIRPEGRQSVRLAYATPAFADWADRRSIESFPTALIQLEPGTTLDDLAANGPSVSPILTKADQADAVARGVDPDALVLWLIAAMGLVGSVIVLGPVLARMEREIRVDHSVLRALGFERSDLRSIGALHGFGLVAVAMPIAIAVAVGLSGVMPTGEAGPSSRTPGSTST